MEMTEFWTVCSSNGIVLELDQLKSIERYVAEIKYWNEKVNLISRKDEDRIIENHILHSLTVLKYAEIPQKAHCLDIGTGGGFPGLPVSIARPDVHMLLTDSIAKKLKITDMFAKHTGNKLLKAKNIRVENLCDKQDYQKRFDVIFARAVTRIINLMDWTERLLKQNGKYVLLKGGDLTEEIAEAKEEYPAYNFEVIDIDFFGAPWFKEEEKKVVIVSKKRE